MRHVAVTVAAAGNAAPFVPLPNRMRERNSSSVSTMKCSSAGRLAVDEVDPLGVDRLGRRAVEDTETASVDIGAGVMPSGGGDVEVEQRLVVRQRTHDAPRARCRPAASWPDPGAAGGSGERRRRHRAGRREDQVAVEAADVADRRAARDRRVEDAVVVLERVGGVPPDVHDRERRVQGVGDDVRVRDRQDLPLVRIRADRAAGQRIEAPPS